MQEAGRSIKSGFDRPKEAHMTLCPVAIAVGCRKCPAFSVCPAKGIIGDFKKDPAGQASQKKTASAAKKGKE